MSGHESRAGPCPCNPGARRRFLPSDSWLTRGVGRSHVREHAARRRERLIEDQSSGFVMPIIWAMSCSCPTSPGRLGLLEHGCVCVAWSSSVESVVCWRAATCEAPTTSWSTPGTAARCCATAVLAGGGPAGKSYWYSESIRAS